MAVGLFALPFAAVLAHVSRPGGGGRLDAAWALRSSLAEVGMVVGTVPWVWMILTPIPGIARGKNLIPFQDLANQFHVGFAFAAMQIGGNLLVFAALGFLLPMRFRVAAVVRALLSARCSRLRSRPCSGSCGSAASRRLMM